MSDTVRFLRRYRFSASHLYRRDDWTEERNRATFGKCANLPGHGHNYRLWIGVSGEVAPDTGFAANLAAVDELVREQVLDVLDHQHLNFAVPEFGAGQRIPTSENLVLWIRDRLRGTLGGTLTLVRVDEDDDLAAEWTPTPG